MGLWVKHFVDGSKEVGTDKSIACHEASWTQGQLADIAKVLLNDDRLSVTVAVPDTQWYQFDRFIATVQIGLNDSIRVSRVVQAKITQHHIGQQLVMRDSGDNVFAVELCNDRVLTQAHNEQSVRINRVDLDKWLTVVLPQQGDPYLRFGTHGKING